MISRTLFIIFFYFKIVCVYIFMFCFMLFSFFLHAVKDSEIKYKPYMMASNIALGASRLVIQKGVRCEIEIDSIPRDEYNAKKDFYDKFYLSCGDLREGKYKSHIRAKKKILSNELVGIISGTLYLKKNNLENKDFFDLLVKNNRYDQAFRLYALNDNFGIIREGVASHEAKVSLIYYSSLIECENDNKKGSFTFFLGPSLYLTPWHLIKSACDRGEMNVMRKVFSLDGTNCMGLAWYATKDIDVGCELLGDTFLVGTRDPKEYGEKLEKIRSQTLRDVIGGYTKDLGDLIQKVRKLNKGIPTENKYDYKTKSRQEKIF